MKPGPVAVEYLGRVNLRRWLDLGRDDLSLKDMLEETPPKRAIEDAEIIRVIDESCLEIRIGEDQNLLSHFDGSVWIELLDEEGEYFAVFLLLPYFATIKSSPP